MKYSVSIILAIGLLAQTNYARPLLNNQGLDATGAGGANGAGLVESVLGKRQGAEAGSPSDFGAPADGEVDAAGKLVDFATGSTVPSMVQPVTGTASKLALDPAEKLVASTGATGDVSSLTGNLLNGANGGATAASGNKKRAPADTDANTDTGDEDGADADVDTKSSKKKENNDDKTKKNKGDDDNKKAATKTDKKQKEGDDDANNKQTETTDDEPAAAATP